LLATCILSRRDITWGKFPIWGKNEISVGIFFKSLCSKWGIFGFVSIKYLGNFEIPYVVNGEFKEIFWGILKNLSGNTGTQLSR
jgi:hypothetical protein